MKSCITSFGFLPNGMEAKLFTFTSKNNLKVSITNYGGIITSIVMPDKNGNFDEICAGFPNLESYLTNHPYFGVIVGRYANRIAKGQFKIGNQEYKLPINNVPNHLHGGINGFHRKLWEYQHTQNHNSATLKLKYYSSDMEEGYPGNLNTEVTYYLSDENDITIDFRASTDKPTHVNLTSHGYFNLGGFRNNIFDHELMLKAKQYLEIDQTQIPTGKFLDCNSTPFDFSEPIQLGKSIMKIEGGLDHCFALDNLNGIDTPSAMLSHPESGRRLTIFCTHPGMQVYSSNWLDGSFTGHNGIKYSKYSAICLEMQHFPNTPNQANFPSTLINPGKEYYQKAKFVFNCFK
jgi:aldose 1-epimerase